MIKKVFGQMLVAQVLSAMTVMICMLVDSIIIGRFLGVNAMTAYGLSNPVLLVFAAAGSMLTAGIQVVCGKSMGSGDRKGINRCFSASVFMTLTFSVVGLCLVLMLSAPLCTFLGAGKAAPDNQIFFLTRDYLRGFILGAPAFLCAMIMVPFMQMAGERFRLVAAIIAMTVVDITADLLNVYVFHGGMLGMGLASSISYYIALLIGGSYFLKKNSMFRFDAKGIKAKLCAAIAGHGVPTMINQVSLVLLVFLINKLLLGVGGTISVAAYSIVTTVSNLCYSFGSGIGSVALMMGSMFYSDEDRRSLRAVVGSMSFYSLVLNAAMIVLIFTAAPLIAGLFLADDPTAQGLAALGVRLFSLSLIANAFNTAFKNYYQGIGRVKLTNAISVMQSFAAIGFSAWLLSRFFGTTGVWLAWLCGETITLLFISAVVWIKNKKVAVSTEAYALLPEDLGVAEEDCLDVTVRTTEETVSASEQAALFCLRHGESDRDSRVIALCIEETANNIVQHGFTKDRRKDHVIEIRLVFKDGKRMIRIRDNCVNFDPVAYMELHKTDDPTKHIGIRLVMRMVKDANYVSSLGLNNLTLIL